MKAARLTKAEFHNIMERLIKKYKKSEEWADKVNDVFPGAFENIYPFSARRPPPLRWGMNCVPVPNVFDNKSKI